VVAVNIAKVTLLKMANSTATLSLGMRKAATAIASSAMVHVGEQVIILIHKSITVIIQGITDLITRGLTGIFTAI